MSRLKTFTKAFQHFFQKPGKPAVFAFVVVIAFQDFGFGVASRREGHSKLRAAGTKFKSEQISPEADTRSI
jgi:hypothetical protein